MMLIVALALDAGSGVSAVIRLKDGTVYQLQAPPHMSGSRFVFTTSEGRLLSIAESEVDEIRLTPAASEPRAGLNPQDSRALGAIARQQRRNHGKFTLIAPAPTPRGKKGSAAP